MYIAIEGIDGSGKDTQAEALAAHMLRVGMDPVICTEPWDRTDIGKLLRHELSEGKFPKAHAALFLADRMALQETFVVPQLKQGKDVICVRSFVSTLAYQQMHHRFSWLCAMHTSMLAYPDHIVYIDVTPEVGLGRVYARGGKVEIYEKVDKLHKIRDDYLNILGSGTLGDIYAASGLRHSPAVHIVDGSESAENVTRSIIDAIGEIPVQIPLAL